MAILDNGPERAARVVNALVPPAKVLHRVVKALDEKSRRSDESCQLTRTVKRSVRNIRPTCCHYPGWCGMCKGKRRRALWSSFSGVHQ